MQGVFAHLYKESKERQGQVPNPEEADFNAHAVMGTLCPALYPPAPVPAHDKEAVKHQLDGFLHPGCTQTAAPLSRAICSARS